MLRSFAKFGMESSKSKGRKGSAKGMNQNAMADFDNLPSGSFDSNS